MKPSGTSGAGEAPAVVRALAPAKVNPWLEVLARRPDGYHEIDTWMLALDWADELEVRVTDEPGIRIEVAGEAASSDVPADDRNLAWRAAAAVREAGGAAAAERGLALSIEKRVPARAGLGGGSADAAAAALATRRALGVAIDDGGLAELVARLGSDCAFFVRARRTGFARCKGRGEEVDPQPLGAFGASVLALVVPAVESPTAAVYRALGFPLREAPGVHSFRSNPADARSSAMRASLFNRLERAALDALPELRSWRDLLDRAGCEHFRLSGSGSSFFGLYEDEARARVDLDAITERASERGLGLRAARVARPSGAGARLVDLDPGGR